LNRPKELNAKDAPQIVQSFCAVQKEANSTGTVHIQKRYTGFVLSMKSVAKRQKECLHPQFSG